MNHKLSYTYNSKNENARYRYIAVFVGVLRYILVAREGIATANWRRAQLTSSPPHPAAHYSRAQKDGHAGGTLPCLKRAYYSSYLFGANGIIKRKARSLLYYREIIAVCTTEYNNRTKHFDSVLLKTQVMGKIHGITRLLLEQVYIIKISLERARKGLQAAGKRFSLL